MSDKKINPNDLTNDLIVADAMLRLTALEKVLINKGLVTVEELSEMTDKLVAQISKVILDRLQSSKTVDDFIEALGKSPKKDNQN